MENYLVDLMAVLMVEWREVNLVFLLVEVMVDPTDDRLGKKRVGPMVDLTVALMEYCWVVL